MLGDFNAIISGINRCVIHVIHAYMPTCLLGIGDTQKNQKFRNPELRVYRVELFTE